jgi:hypothetical protein
MNIECFEDYKNLVDWYYENEWSQNTLHEDLYPLPLLATSQVESCIEESFYENVHLTTAAFKVKEIITEYYFKNISGD